MVTCNLGIVLELTGAFSATALAYVLPPLCYLKLSKGSIWQWDRIPHWLCVLFGLTIMFISTFQSLQKVFMGHPQQSLPMRMVQRVIYSHRRTCLTSPIIIYKPLIQRRLSPVKYIRNLRWMATRPVLGESINFLVDKTKNRAHEQVCTTIT